MPETHKWLFFSLIAVILYHIPDLHGLIGYPLTRGPATPEPNPKISREEANNDMPSLEEFDKSPYQKISKAKAYSFTTGGKPSACDKHFRKAIQEASRNEEILLTSLPGKTGLCEAWYSLKIVKKKNHSEILGHYIRPGPRRSGQLPGRDQTINEKQVEITTTVGQPEILKTEKTR